MRKLLVYALLVLLLSPDPTFAATFYVRADGGTRYDASLNPTGRCTGTTDAADPGSGTNQPCGFGDLRLLYNLGTGTNITNWAMVGGDTAVIDAKSGGWRVGGDGTSGPYTFCDNSNYWVCSFPPPPNGTSGSHTRFIGRCAFGSYICTPITDYPLGTINESQIFGGYAAPVTIWLGGANYVEFVGLEITEHNHADPAAHPAYNNDTTYNQSDSVTFGGVVYVSLQGSNTTHDPDVSPTWWMVATQCTSIGAPSAPAVYCNKNNPGDDYSEFGIISNGPQGSSGAGNITLQDVYIHGFTESGIGGPIDGPWNLTRVLLGFNTFAGWNFDDGLAGGVTAYSVTSNVITVTASNPFSAGRVVTLKDFPTSTFLNGVSLTVTSATGTQFVAPFTHADASATENGQWVSSTPDGPGSSITADYFTVIGNGSLEEYPIVHTQFPALSFWEASTGGFGDGLSGQDTVLDSFVCHHCGLFYNSKDAFIGPHTQITNLNVQDSTSAGNMGSEWKWALGFNATALFQNNLIVENCTRMEEALPGAKQNFFISTGLLGSYLSNFCRAGGESFNYLERNNDTINFVGNTVIGAATIMYAAGCGFYTPGNVFNLENDCLDNPNIIKGNNFLAYTSPNQGAAAPALFYVDPDNPNVVLTSSYNNEYGNRSDGTPQDTCGVNHITCVNPLMVNQPTTPWPGTEAGLDVFNASGGSGNSFYPTPTGPLHNAGTAISGLATDYYGVSRPTAPTLGGAEPAGSVGGTVIGGGVVFSGSVIIQ